MAVNNETYNINIKTVGSDEVVKLTTGIKHLKTEINLLEKKKFALEFENTNITKKLDLVKQEIQSIIKEIDILKAKRVEFGVENIENLNSKLQKTKEELTIVNAKIKGIGDKKIKVGEIDKRSLDNVIGQISVIQNKITEMYQMPESAKKKIENFAEIFKDLKLQKKELQAKSVEIMKGSDIETVKKINKELAELRVKQRELVSEKRSLKDALKTNEASEDMLKVDKQILSLEKRLVSLSSTEVKLSFPDTEGQILKVTKAIEDNEAKVKSNQDAILKAYQTAKQAYKDEQELQDKVLDAKIEEERLVKELANTETIAHQVVMKALQAKSDKQKQINDDQLNQTTKLKNEYQASLKTVTDAITAQGEASKKSLVEQAAANKQLTEAITKHALVAKENFKQQIALQKEVVSENKKAQSALETASGKTIAAQEKLASLTKIAATEQKKSYESLNNVLKNNTSANKKASEIQQKNASKAVNAVNTQIKVVQALTSTENQLAKTAESVGKREKEITEVVNKTKKEQLAIEEKIRDIQGIKKTNLNDTVNSIVNLRNAVQGLQPLATMLNGIGTALTKIASGAIKEAMTWEVLRVKLGNFYNTATESTEAFNYLVEKAKTTPFEIKGLVQAAVMLKAFGMDMEKGVELTGNLAAALGGKITDAAYAVSRAMSGASMGFLMLQRTWGVSRSKLKALGAEFMAGNRLIAASVKTQKALQQVLEENNGAMDRLSKTAQGKLSNLTDALDTFKESAGRSFLPVITSAITGITSVVDYLAKIPDTLKFIGVGAIGIVGILALTASKAMGAAIAIANLARAYEKYNEAVALGKVVDITAKFSNMTKVINTFPSTVSTFLVGTGKMGAGVASLGNLFGGLLVSMTGVIAVAAGVILAMTLIQEAQTKALELETAKHVDLLRGSLNDLRNYYPETYSQAAIFNKIIEGSSIALLTAGDSAYKYKGKLKDLFNMTEDEYLKQQQAVEKAVKNRITLFEESYKKEEELLEESTRRKNNILATHGNTVSIKKYNDQIEDSSNKMKLYEDQINKNKKTLEELHEVFEDGKRKIQVYGALYYDLQEQLGELEDKDKVDKYNVMQQLDVAKQILTLRVKVEKDYYDQINVMAKDHTKSFLEMTKEKVKLDKDFTDFKLLSENDRFEFEEKYNKILTELNKTSYNDVLKMERDKYAELDRMRKNNIITEKEYNERRLEAEKGFIRLKAEAKNTDATLKDNLDRDLKRNQDHLKNKLISEKQYIASIVEYMKVNADRLTYMPEVVTKLTKEITDHTIADMKNHWNEFLTTQQTALKNQDITQGQYIASLQGYLDDNMDYYSTHVEDRLDLEKLIVTETARMEEQVYKDKLKMQDDYITAKFGKDEASYIKSLTTLNKQREDYINNSNDKIEVDKWYYAKKAELDANYLVQQKKNLIKFQSDLAKSKTGVGSFDEQRVEANKFYKEELLNLAELAKEYTRQGKDKIEIAQMVSGERIRIEQEYSNKMQSILLQEEQFYDDMYKKVLDNFVARGELTEANYLRMQKSMLDESIKRHEEAAKIIEKNILAGNSVSKAEAEIYDVYIKQEQTLIDINEQLNTRLDSTGKIYDSNMDILKQDLELKKLRGEISDEKALMIELKYRQDYLQTHKDEIELLKQKFARREELTQQEQEIYKTYLSESIEQENQLDNYEELTKTAKKVKNEVTGVDEAVKSATKSTDKLSSSMENVADSTAKASNEMVQYGNILAGAADTASGMGNFGTMESMLSNLPGTQGVTHENLPYDIVEEMGRSLTDRDMWNDVFDGFYEELGEKTIDANRKDFEEELAEKREFWKRELEDTSLKISGMATDTKTAMDSMSADINTFSQKEVVVNVNVQGGTGEDNPSTQPPNGGGEYGGGSTGGDSSSSSSSSSSGGTENPYINPGGGSGSDYNLEDVLNSTPDGLHEIPGSPGHFMDDSGSFNVYQDTGSGDIQTIQDVYNYDNNSHFSNNNAPTGTTFSGGQAHAPIKENEKSLKAFGFDNPKNDAVAKSLGAKQSTSIINILQKNTTDILKNYLKGTSEAVKKMYSSTVSNNSNINNSNINNSRVTKSIYNTNLNGQALQHTPVPIQRSVKAISDYATRGRYSGGKL